MGGGSGDEIDGSIVSCNTCEGRNAGDVREREVSRKPSAFVTGRSNSRADLRSPVVAFLIRGGDGGLSSMGGRSGTSMLLRTVRDSGRGVL